MRNEEKEVFFPKHNHSSTAFPTLHSLVQHFVLFMSHTILIQINTEKIVIGTHIVKKKKKTVPEANIHTEYIFPINYPCSDCLI